MDLIGREHPTSDDKPPWAGMVFKQQVYSDAMLECLKRRYPQGANLRERKHMAAIEFLQQELKEMQEKEEALTIQTRPDVVVNDVVLHGRKYQGSSSPPLSPTDSFQSPTVTDGLCHGINIANTKSLKRPSAVSNINLGQEIVFSVADGPIAQRQKRKKMSTTEKLAYKQMRKIGACESCKRQKAKCTHANGMSNGPNDSQTAISAPQRDEPLHADAITPQLDASIEQSPPIRALKRSQEPQQQHDASFQRPSIMTPATTPGSPRWNQDTRDSAQSESAGYVPISATSGHYSVAPYSTHEFQRSTIDPQLLTIGYPSHVGINRATESFPMSMAQRTIPFVVPYQDSVPANVWSQFQGYHMDETNPD